MKSGKMLKQLKTLEHNLSEAVLYLRLRDRPLTAVEERELWQLVINSSTILTHAAIQSLEKADASEGVRTEAGNDYPGKNA